MVYKGGFAFINMAFAWVIWERKEFWFKEIGLAAKRDAFFRMNGVTYRV